MQYAVDTLFVGEASWENIWTMKVSLRMFDLMSGLKVNYHKSSLIGINYHRLDMRFLQEVADVLNCKVGSCPFNYLGLPIGANSRKSATWKPVLETLSRRLQSWEFRFLSIGGRVSLINLVLNSISVFFACV